MTIPNRRTRLSFFRAQQQHIYEPPQPVYAFGSNGNGQLGLRHVDDTSTPERLPYHDIFSALRINGSGNQTILWMGAPDVNPHLVVLGEDPSYQELPYMQSHSKESGPELCAATWNAFAQARWRDSDDHDKGMVIETFGSSDKGQLGRPAVLDPKPCMDNRYGVAAVPELICVAGGVQHFIAVIKSGSVVGWGNGRKGQLGEPVEAIVPQPRLLQAGFDVVYAVCGREFSLLLGEPSQGHFTILGSDKYGIKTDAPTDLKGWKSAGASWSTISILLDDGSVVSWGRNDHGQRAPKGLPPIEKIAVGSEHTVALSKDGEVLVWGWGEHGNCGEDVDKQLDVKDGWKVIPRPADAPKDMPVIGVGAGCATSFFWFAPSDE